ncbi:hypothetical protein K1719_011144 [Acacia pycnantha]|nr:hypothetical protein K1719_011144 [Acacia pycnantha]
MDDYMEALVGGPWVIADAYLNVARWRPEFNPKNERIESVVAWVRLPDLPAPLFDKKFLLNLGNSIGKAIRLDIHTAQRARGKFVRMCVELDLTKPLVPAFNVEGQILSVEYESLGSLCSKCGRVGHNQKNCDDFHKRSNEGGMDIKDEGEHVVKEVNNGGDGGKWKIVQRGRRLKREVAETKGAPGGSRFTVLNDKIEDVDQSRGGEGMQKEIRSDGNVREGQHEFVAKVQRKPEKSGSRGGGQKGVEKSGASGMEKRSQEGKKERVEKVKKGIVRAQNGLVASGSKEKNVEEVCPEWGPGSIRDMKQGAPLSMDDKENLHPGGSGIGMTRLKDMGIGSRQSVGTDRVLYDNVELSMGEEFRTPALVD